jgi:uncharacterized protein
LLYTAIGGGFEIGANCHLVQLGGTNVVLDCGLRPHAGGPEALPDLDQLDALTDGRVDALFITHAHRDHAGAIGEFRRRHTTTPVYASEATCELVGALASSWSGPPTAEPGSLLARPYGEWFEIAYGIEGCLTQAGHVVGAASVTLRASDASVMFCADIATAAHRMTGVFQAPDDISPDVMILGAMGGDRALDARRRKEGALVADVAEVVGAGGSAVVVADRFGRAQEIVLALRSSMMSGQTPRFPVRVARDVAGICDVLGRMLPHLADPLRRYVVNSRRDLFWADGSATTPDILPMPEGPAHAWTDAGPACAIVAPSPGAASPLTEYAEAVAHDAHSAIFVPASGDEDDLPAPLRAALDGGWVPSPDGRLSVACRVQTYDVPMHADQPQLCSVVNAVKPSAVVLTHGRPDAIQALRHKLSGARPVYTPMNGDTFDPLAPAPVADADTPAPRIKIDDGDGPLVMKLGADAMAHPDFRRHFQGYERIEARFDGNRLTLRPTVDRDDD